VSTMNRDHTQLWTSFRDQSVTTGMMEAVYARAIPLLTCTYLARWEGFEPPTF
jgi:hypothetical protein